MWRNRYGRRHRQWRDQGRGDRRCVLSIESKAPSISSDLIQKSGSGGNVPCIGYSEISVRNAVPISLPRNGLSICRIIAFGMCGRAIPASIGLRIRFTCRVSRQMHHKPPVTPAAWRYSPRSAALHRDKHDLDQRRDVGVLQRILGHQSLWRLWQPLGRKKSGDSVRS